MTEFQPMRLAHLELGEALSRADAKAGAEGRDLHAVFWRRGIPLGQETLISTGLVYPRTLAHLVAFRVAPAVGDRLFGPRFPSPASELDTTRTGVPGLHLGSAEPPGETGPWPRFDPTDLLTGSSLLARLDDLENEPDRTEDLSISVVVCTRNRPDQLLRFLASLEESTARPNEVIVVDNAPDTGRTREFVEDRPGVVYVAEPKPGLSAARNTGVLESSGDIVAFADDDTVVHRDWLRRLRPAFDDDRVMAVLGLVLPAELETPAQVVFEQEMGGLGRGYRRLDYDEEFLEGLEPWGPPVWWMGAGANMAIRREAFDLVGPFDERLGAGAAGCSEDSEFWYRLLAERWCCRYEPTAVVFHFHRADFEGLRWQAREYARGHLAALFVQYARHGHRGNLRRAFTVLPRYFLRQGFRELGPGASPRRGTYGAELGGYVRGLALLPYALPRRASARRIVADGEGGAGGLPKHKAPLHEFLAKNPFPNPLTEGFFYREKMRAIHAVAPDVPARRILEVGGGQSGLTSLLYPFACVTNLDSNPQYADSPPNLRSRTRFVVGDATELPFEDDSFDGVTMFDVLEHIPNDAAAAAEALRVLRPGGFLVITTPNESWRFPFYRPFRRICPPEEEMTAEWGHVRRGYSLADLERLVGARAKASASFITPVTVLCHDISFSKLPSRVRRALCAALSPVTLLGYSLQSASTRGTETAVCWQIGELERATS